MLRLLFLLTFGLAVLLLFCGSADYAPSDVWQVIQSEFCMALGLSEVSMVAPQTTTDFSTLRFIIMEHRLPQMLTAAMAGASLAVGGLVMQSLFRNPLADPSLLGINSGASLGVALALLCRPLLAFLAWSEWANVSLQVVSAFGGALLILFLLLLAMRSIHSSAAFLVLGVMFSCLCTSVVLLLQFYASHEVLRGFLLWGMGSFSTVGADKIPFLLLALLLPLGGIGLFVRSLDALLLGEHYAQSMGISVERSKWCLLLGVGWITAVVTAFCGPVAFVGLAVPHMARRYLRSNLHHRLLPAAAFMGAIVCMFCVFVTQLPSDGSLLPLGAITPLLGAPVVIALIWRKG